MTRIVIVAKNGGDLLQDTQASEVVLSQPSVVQVGVTKDAVESITREGNNVVIVLKNGEKIVVDNFFNDANNADNSLVFPEQDKGFALVEFDSANGAVNYLGLDNLEPLLYSNDTAGLIAWLFPVVTAGGILWWAHRDHDSHKDQSSPTAKATLTSITDDTGVSSTDLITNDKTLILSGKVTQPLATDETVQISLDGGKTWLNTVVDRNNGSWSYDNTQNPLVDGVYTVQVRTVDEAGNIGPISEQKITIDTVVPTDGSLSEVKLLDDVGAVTGQIKDGTSTDDTRPELIGRATPDVEHVNVYDKGSLIGTATVKADGTWTFTPTTPLTSGPHAFTAKPVDKAGNEGVATDPIDFNVIGSVPLVPTIEMLTDNAGDVTGALKKGSTTDDKTPIVSGTAQPGTIVHVYSNGKDVGSVAVKPDGTWALEVADLGTDGEKKLTAVAQDPAGQMSPSTKMEQKLVRPQ